MRGILSPCPSVQYPPLVDGLHLIVGSTAVSTNSSNPCHRNSLSLSFSLVFTLFAFCYEADLPGVPKVAAPQSTTGESGGFGFFNVYASDPVLCNLSPVDLGNRGVHQVGPEASHAGPDHKRLPRSALS